MMAMFSLTFALPLDNPTIALSDLINKLGVGVTRQSIRQAIHTHPYAPSLLSLSDALHSWHINNTALKLDSFEQLRHIPLPVLVHLEFKGGWYVVVTNVKGNNISYIDSERGEVTEHIDSFIKLWTGTVLVAEASEDSGETDFSRKQIKQKLVHLRGPFVYISVFIVLMLGIILNRTKIDFLTGMLFLTKALGLLISILLVAKQMGYTNAFVNRLCSTTDKADCDDILNSPAAKLGGWLSWSDIGLVYFAGGLISLLVMSGTKGSIAVILCVSVIALPYPIWSVYYQGLIAKRWCPLCLCVQAVLVVEGLVALNQSIWLPSFSYLYGVFAIVFIAVLVIWVVLQPLLSMVQKGHHRYEELLKLKRNPALFQAMLNQHPKKMLTPIGLKTIILGNVNASHTIILVTNPFCGPCEQAHKELEILLGQTNDINVEVIFLACDGERGNVHNIARHMIALHDEGVDKNYMNDWYSNSAKNYTEWSSRHPVSNKLSNYDSTVLAHCTWCWESKITATPTLFVNEYMLPNIYNISDLQWMVTTLPSLKSVNLVKL